MAFLAGLAILAALAYVASKALRSTFRRKGAMKNPAAPVAPDTLVAIGQPVLLHPGRKKPPYAITVLGPPEPAHTTMVRVPVRITCVIPRWAFDDVVYIQASLHDRRHRDGTACYWPATWDGPSVAREGSFRGVILALGGTHEGFLYFEADDDCDARTAPEQPFRALQYLDRTGSLIEVDLTRWVPKPERTTFPDGTPLGDVTSRRIMVKTSRYGWKWSGAPSTAGIGETVEVTHVAGRSWLRLTVLARPETSGGALVRLPVRITARARGEECYTFFPLQISTPPDGNGRIHHLWEFVGIDPEDAALTDSLHCVRLKKGQSAEGFVYFGPAEASDRAIPADAFKTLWYGPWMEEIPVELVADK